MTSLLWFTFVMVVVDVLYSFVIVNAAFVLNNFLFLTWHRLLFFFILNFIYSFRLSFFLNGEKKRTSSFQKCLCDDFFSFFTLSCLLV